MKHLSLIILLLFLFSCQDKKKEEIKHLISKWQGKEIQFPQDMVFMRFNSDTIYHTIPNSSHKVLVYVDSIGCTSCKLQLPRWKELIQYIDSTSQETVPFLFFFHPNDKNEIRYLRKREGFNTPVCFDQSDKLNQLNHFPTDNRYQTFLLDKANKVLIIGNPIHNSNIKDLYLQEISGEKLSSQIQTTVKIKEESIQLGTITLGESKEAIFTLTNTGNCSLVIIDVATTCGCAKPTFDKHPAKPGEALQVKVYMTPKDRGFFYETITVKCNANQPIKLNIRGTTL